jgi:ankyrin repeat protein
VRELIESYPTYIDTRKKDQTGLMKAAKHKRRDIVKLLLKKGANREEVTGEKNYTAFDIAMRSGILDIAYDLLIKTPLIIDCENLLLWAVNNNRIDAVKTLLDKNVDPNLVDYSSKTLLISAVEIGHADLVTILIKHGADRDKTTSYGVSPLAIALQNKALGRHKDTDAIITALTFEKTKTIDDPSLQLKALLHIIKEEYSVDTQIEAIVMEIINNNIQFATTEIKDEFKNSLNKNVFKNTNFVREDLIYELFALQKILLPKVIQLTPSANEHELSL